MVWLVVFPQHIGFLLFYQLPDLRLATAYSILPPGGSRCGPHLPLSATRMAGPAASFPALVGSAAFRITKLSAPPSFHEMVF